MNPLTPDEARKVILKHYIEHAYELKAAQLELARAQQRVDNVKVNMKDTEDEMKKWVGANIPILYFKNPNNNNTLIVVTPEKIFKTSFQF